MLTDRLVHSKRSKEIEFVGMPGWTMRSLWQHELPPQWHGALEQP